MGRDRQVVNLSRTERQIETGAGKGLHERHGGGNAEGPHRDPDVCGRKTASRGHCPSSPAMSVANMLWWFRPQYSLHTIRYSPGSSNVMVNWLT